MLVQFSINFIFRTKCTNIENNKNSKGYIYLRFTKGRISHFKSLRIPVNSKNWNGKAPKWVLSNKDFDGSKLNLALNKLYQKAERIRIETIDNETDLDFKQFISLLFNEKKKGHSLHEVMQLIETRKTAKGRDQVTLNKDWSDYRQFLVFLYNKDRKTKRDFVMRFRKDFQDLYAFGDSFHVENINEELVEQYESHIRNKEGNKQATIYKKLNLLRQICKLAKKKKWLVEDPFEDYEMSQGSSTPVYNTLEEVESLYNLWKSKALLKSRLHLHKTLRRYLIAFGTGQHYKDLIEMRNDEIDLNYARPCFERKRAKNNNPYFVPLFRFISEVIEEKIEEDSEKVVSPISNQKFNEYLKEVMKVIGCRKGISTKAARHSFSSLLFDFKIEEATVAIMLGHRTNTITQHYIHINKRFLVDEIDRVEKEFNKMGYFQ